jgi:hypothetical protein
VCDYDACAVGAERVGIELAFESEFGNEASPAVNVRKVMDDFSKLRDLRARVKVMLYLYYPQHHDALRSMMIRLADAHPVRQIPMDSYLLIGAPWNAPAWSPEVRESLWTFHGRAGEGEWTPVEA